MEGKEEESKINEKNHNELISWLEERKLGKNLVPVLFNLGVNSVHDLKLVKEQDFVGINSVSPILARKLVEEIKKYNSFSPIQGFQRLGRILYAVFTYAIMFVLVRVWGQMMPSHSYFYSMSWAVGFIPMFAIFLAFRRKYFNEQRSELDANWPMIKQSVFVAFTYAVNYWGVSTSAPHVTGPAQVIFSQVPTVAAAIFTVIAFRRKYHPLAVVGILLTIAGTVVQSVGGGVSGSAKIGWILVFVAGNIPGAIWAVVFEGFHKTKGTDGKTNTMELRMVWTNFFLVLWLLLFIPFFGLLNQPPLGSFTDNFWKATRCVFTGKGGELEDNCKQAGWILGLTIPVAALQAHSQIVLSRDDTGLFATLALSCAPFLADLAFPFKIIMGQYADPVSHWDFLAAGLCLVGVLLYAVMEHLEHRDTQKEVDESKFIKWFSSLEEPKWLPKFLREKRNPKKEEETSLLKSNSHVVNESP